MRALLAVSFATAVFAAAGCEQDSCDTACNELQAHLDGLECGDDIAIQPNCHLIDIGRCDCDEATYYRCLIDFTRCEGAVDADGQPVEGRGRLVGPTADECPLTACTAPDFAPGAADDEPN